MAALSACFRTASERAAAFRLFKLARNCSASRASRAALRTASGETGLSPSFFIAKDLPAHRKSLFGRAVLGNPIGLQTVACDGLSLMAVSGRVAQSAARFVCRYKSSPGRGPFEGRVLLP